MPNTTEYYASMPFGCRSPSHDPPPPPPPPPPPRVNMPLPGTRQDSQVNMLRPALGCHHTGGLSGSGSSQDLDSLQVTCSLRG